MYWRKKTRNGLDLAVRGRDAISSHFEAEILDLVVREETLGRLELEAGGLEARQHLVDRFEMLVERAREDQHVVDVDEALAPRETVEHSVDESLEGARRVHAAKRHHVELIQL